MTLYIGIPLVLLYLYTSYKMPKMILKVEGKGNGIMTNITNLEDVAKSLRVPASYPHKYFGIELGTLTKTKTDSFIVNGKHDIGAMEKILDKFIEKYILCPLCKLPEMTLKTKKDSLLGSCRSCGKVSKLDTVHKIATFILKNPPKDDSEFADGKHKSKLKAKETVKEEPKLKATKEHKEHSSKEAKDSKEGRKTATAAEEHKVVIETLSITSPEVVESANRIRDYKNAQARTASELVDQISNICISQGLKDDLKYYVAIHGLFDDKFLHQWALDQSSKEAIKTLAEKEDKGQYWVLLAIQYFAMKTHAAALMEYLNTILKCFYDFGILDEEIIIKCYGKEDGTKTLSLGKSFNPELNSQFKKEIQVFVKWLQEAEEDSEGEEDKKDAAEDSKEDENVKRQKQLIAEQKRLQELKLQESKDKAKAENEAKVEGPKPLDILGIQAESKAASIDDL